MGKSWFTVYSQPNKEEALWRQLQHRSIEVFYPRVKVNPVNPRSRNFRPYFPRYLFIRVDLAEEGLTSLQYIPFAVGLVSFGGEPAEVPQSFIQTLKQKTLDIQRAGGEVFIDLKPGDPIRIEQGLFKGYEALFDMRLPGSDRVQVLLKMLSDRPVRVEMDAAQIKKLGNR